jgi:hypothetical protein
MPSREQASTRWPPRDLGGGWGGAGGQLWVNRGY